jgi:AAA15 family ATPase/GTPase
MLRRTGAEKTNVLSALSLLVYKLEKPASEMKSLEYLL